MSNTRVCTSGGFHCVPTSPMNSGPWYLLYVQCHILLRKEEIEGGECSIQCWISNGDSPEELWLPQMPSTILTEAVKAPDLCQAYVLSAFTV